MFAEPFLNVCNGTYLKLGATLLVNNKCLPKPHGGMRFELALPCFFDARVFFSGE